MRSAATLNDILCVIPGDGVAKNAFFFHFKADSASGGEVFLYKKDLDSIGRINLTLKMQTGDDVVTVKNLMITNTQLIGVHQEPNALYRVTLHCPLFFPQRMNLGIGESFFPPVLFPDSWEAAMLQHWGAVFGGLIDQTDTDYPSILLSDVEFQNPVSGLEAFTSILNLASHSLYYDGEDYSIKKWSHVDTANETLADNNKSKLILRKQDETTLATKMPTTVYVKFRSGDPSINPVQYDIDYAGNLDNGNFFKEIYVFNVADSSFSEGDRVTLATEIANLYFDSFIQQEAELNAIYFGVVPFEHSPNCHDIRIFHDLSDNTIKTMVMSVDPSEINTVLVSSTTTSGTGVVDEDIVNGDYACCTCEYPLLFVSIGGDGITWEQVLVKNRWPYKSANDLIQKIILTSDDDPAEQREVELAGIDCDGVECQTVDMSGEYVGTREIGIIKFGNSASCVDAEGDLCDLATAPYTATGSNTLTTASPTLSVPLSLQPKFSTSKLSVTMEVQLTAPGTNDIQTFARFTFGDQTPDFNPYGITIYSFRTFAMSEIWVIAKPVVGGVGIGTPTYTIPLDELAHTLRLEQDDVGYNLYLDDVLIWGVGGSNTCAGRTFFGYTGGVTTGDGSTALDVTYSGGYY